MDLKISVLAKGLSFGARVSGLTLEMLRDADVRRSIYDLWIRDGVVVFEGVEGEELHLELSRCFGKLIGHPTPEARAGHAELMAIHYEPVGGWLTEVDGEQLGNWLPWHSDLIYVDRINHGGVLRPVVLPEQLGYTGFLDKIAAYDSLPRHLKERGEGLNVLYKHDLNPEVQKFGRTADVRVVRYASNVAAIQARLDDYPRVVHPLVYVQRETGRRVLNLSPWFAVGIEGMENEEGDALLEEIARHIVNSPHRYIHQWKMGDMVAWDNWRVLHNASGCPSGEVRSMLRTTIEGDYGLGHNEYAASADGLHYINV